MYCSFPPNYPKHNWRCLGESPWRWCPWSAFLPWGSSVILLTSRCTGGWIPFLTAWKKSWRWTWKDKWRKNRTAQSMTVLLCGRKLIFILPTYILFMLVGLLCYGLLGPSANAIHKLSWFNSLHFLENMSCATCNMQVNAGASGCLVPNGFVTFL